MVKFQSGELLIWDTLLVPNMGYPVLGDFEESAQEPTLRFNIQTATQSTGFSDVQLNEANYSSQSTMASSDFHFVFSHSPTPSTSATRTSSGRTVEAASLSPLSLV